MEHSQCDKHARKYFKYSAGAYVFYGDLQAYERELWEWFNEEQQGSPNWREEDCVSIGQLPSRTT